MIIKLNKNEQQVLFSDRLALAIKWREDVAGMRGEMIESRGNGVYTRDYLSFAGRISQNDLDTICDIANNMWQGFGSDLVIGNSMGELRWGFR